jgi:hypothetical protein
MPGSGVELLEDVQVREGVVTTDEQTHQSESGKGSTFSSSSSSSSSTEYEEAWFDLSPYIQDRMILQEKSHVP